MLPQAPLGLVCVGLALRFLCAHPYTPHWRVAVPTQAQAELDAVVLAALEAGTDVVRLKGGDPFIFGRGGEEVALYRSRGYQPEVIPGISCCIAAPAAAMIPTTMRGLAHRVLVTTAHGRAGSDPDLPPFLPGCTFIFVMVVGRIAVFTEQLVTGGFPADMPATIVQVTSMSRDRAPRSCRS